MKWRTTNEPLPDGWYWKRWQGDTVSRRWSIVEVYKGRWTSFASHNMNNFIGNITRNYEWAGPIPEPERSKAYEI